LASCEVGFIILDQRERTLFMRIQVLAVTSMKTAVFWDVALRSLAETDRRFRSAYFLHVGDSKLLWKAGLFLPDYTAEYLRRQPNASLSSSNIFCYRHPMLLCFTDILSHYSMKHTNRYGLHIICCFFSVSFQQLQFLFWTLLLFLLELLMVRKQDVEFWIRSLRSLKWTGRVTNSTSLELTCCLFVFYLTTLSQYQTI
jgi:hypothetical protein